MYLFSPFSLFVKEMYSQIYTLFAIKSLAFICDVLFPIIAGHELTKKKKTWIKNIWQITISI